MQLGAINSINFESAKNRYRHEKKQRMSQEDTQQYSQRPVNLNSQPNSYRPIKVNLDNINDNIYYEEDANNSAKESKFARQTRRAIAGGAIATSLLIGGAGVTSCDKDPTVYQLPDLPPINHYHKLKFYIICPKPDTIVIRDTITKEVIDSIFIEKIDTLFLKEGLNPPAGDSIRTHLDSLGTNIKGEGNVPLSIMMYDEYMQTAHKMLLDGDNSTDERIVMIDKRSDYSKTDKNNPDPEVSYIRSTFTVAKGKGLHVKHDKLRPWVNPDKKEFEEADWEYKGESIQTLHGNTVVIQQFDKNGDLVRYGDYKKGDKDSSIFYDMLVGDLDNIETVRRRYTQVSSQWATGDEYANRNNPYVEKPVLEEE